MNWNQECTKTTWKLKYIHIYANTTARVARLFNEHKILYNNNWVKLCNITFRDKYIKEIKYCLHTENVRKSPRKRNHQQETRRGKIHHCKHCDKMNAKIKVFERKWKKKSYTLFWCRARYPYQCSALAKCKQILARTCKLNRDRKKKYTNKKELAQLYDQWFDFHWN